jgi:ATP-dependent Lhr-like helicase
MSIHFLGCNILNTSVSFFIIITDMNIPKYVKAWFQQKGWKMHSFQQRMFDFFARQESVLLIAPTGGGKTLASFLPALIDIHINEFKGLHTLYLSPLKALTTDIERNLMEPITAMSLKVSVEIRTGDTTSYRRKRQRTKPPNILLITPESLMLMLSYSDAPTIFGKLKWIIIDELHNFVASKRGDLTALALAQLNYLAPQAVRMGLSATVQYPEKLAAWMGKYPHSAEVYRVKTLLKPDISLLTTSSRIPYSGYMARYAVEDIYQTISQYNMTILFVNTRAQAEFMFRQIWQANQHNYPIAIYHGSLTKDQRLKTEALTVAGGLRAIIATSALELGIDWGNVDCVIQVGAPKGISRLLQRLGRSNHRLNEASVAKLVPSNCFEVLECYCAMQAIAKGHLDGEELQPGSLDVVIQFIVNCACSANVTVDELYNVTRQAYPYRDLEKHIFEQLFEFAINGGYTLKHYEQYHRLVETDFKLFAAASDKVIRRHRQNIGTIVEAARLRVKIMFKKRSKNIGDIEEGFAQQLSPGDTFLFAGEVLEFICIRDMAVETKRSLAKVSKLPSYLGGTMPLSTYLADEVRSLISNPAMWIKLPAKTHEWLNLQKKFSILPDENDILVECFPYKKTFYCMIYSFEGRRANHTLAMLITRRMETQKLKPIGFTVTDYGLAISSLKLISEADIANLLSEDILHEELEDWLKNSPLLKRSFKQVAIIAGLIGRQLAGTRKTMRQVTFSTDLLYDVLLRYEPNHILLAITRADVSRILLDVERLTTMLLRFQEHIKIQFLDRPSPLSVPILTTFKTERLQGEAVFELLTQAEMELEANELIEEVRILVK